MCSKKSTGFERSRVIYVFLFVPPIFGSRPEVVIALCQAKWCKAATGLSRTPAFPKVVLVVNGT